MKNSDFAEILGKDIRVHEMSVKQVEDYINGRIQKKQVVAVDMVMDSHITSDVILLCTDMTEEDLLEAYPSDIAMVIKKIEELNPFFARLAAKAHAQFQPEAGNQ